MLEHRQVGHFYFAEQRTFQLGCYINRFTEAIFNFFGQTLPDKWRDFRDTVTDNFRIVSLKEYKLI